MVESLKEGIAFDKGYFSCILKQAADEGFIKSHQSPWWKFFERVTPAKTKTALQMWLLYGKVYYPDIYLNSPEEIWNLYGDILKNELTKQGLLEITCRSTVLATNEPLVSEHISECMALKQILLSSKGRRRRCFDPFSFGILRGQHSFDYYEKKFEFAVAILGLITRPTDTITTLMDRVEPGVEKHEYYKDNLEDFLEKGCGCVTSNTGRELSRSLFDNSFGQWWSAITGIIRQSEHLASLLYFSDRQSLPVLADDIYAHKTSAKNLKQLEDKLSEAEWKQIRLGIVLFDGERCLPVSPDVVYTRKTSTTNLEQLEDKVSETESSRIALGVFFDEELRPVLPVVSSIKDVVRLRKDRRIRDFRNKIFEWTMALKEDEAKISKIKKDMIEANKKLKTIGRCERVSTWITFLSLPIDVALTLSGLPISIMSSITSFGVACTSKLLKRDYNWYLFGIQ